MTAAARRVLVARLDADGDVLLAGPAVRAVAAHADVVLLVGPRGRQAAELLVGVRDIVTWEAPWIEPMPAPATTTEHVGQLLSQMRSRRLDEAVILTSFHQDPLPLALLLRLAGVVRITAISPDYPGSLLDVRLPDPGDVPEAERALRVASGAGFTLPMGDAGLLAVRRPLPDTTTLTGPDGYVVLHPGTSVPARAWPSPRWRETAATLSRAGVRVVVTGSPAERALTAEVSADGGTDVGGRTTFAELADVLSRARVVVVANTGPAHLAAAVGTPVVSLFAPTVPAARWAPYGVDATVLGDQTAACRETRATICPVPGHPCLDSVTPSRVVHEIERLWAVAA